MNTTHTDPQPDPACQCDLCRQTRQDAESERIVTMLEVTRQTFQPESKAAAKGKDGGKAGQFTRPH